MKKSKPREYSEAVISAVLIAVLIRFFVIEAFKIPSASMVPTLQIGDHIFVNKLIYGLRDPFTKKTLFKISDPKRGDVVVFLYPPDEQKSIFERKDFIKRVVGLPGDRLRTEGTNLYVNGEKVVHTPLKVDADPSDPLMLKVQDSPYWSAIPKDSRHWQELTFMDEVLGDLHHLVQYSPYRSFPDGEYTVPEESLMVMGDNRDNSADSRDWGFMPMRDLKGKAMFVWLSCGEPETPPQTALERGLETVRSTISSIPVIGWLYPCDGHWLSIRWNRFGRWIK